MAFGLCELPYIPSTPHWLWVNLFFQHELTVCCKVAHDPDQLVRQLKVRL